MPTSGWLDHYTARFQTVEVNNTFYRLPEATTFQHWADETPDDFVLAVKMSRYLTHLKRLHDPEEPVQRFLDRASRLGGKLGPILLQLPPNLGIDPERLEETLKLLCPHARVAVEFRHDSWAVDDIRMLLAQYRAAACLFDTPARHGPLWRTTDWTYVRFHEGRGSPRPCYEPASLSGWASLLAREWGPEATIYAFFNNDGRACAVHDAVVFAAAGRDNGLRPSRVPEAGDVHVAP